jgi:iron complex outermembrane receptor protein
MALQGNKNLTLLTTNMIELGYRSRISSKINIDVELFDITGKHFNALVENKSYRETRGLDTLTIVPLIPTNLPLILKQLGVTVSVNYTSKQIQVKPFITIQRTKMKNYAPYGSTPDTGEPLHIYSNMGGEEIIKSTPAVFGGASVNYVPDSKWNFNLNTYYYSSQTYSHLSNVIFRDGIRGIDNMKSKLILNLNISYEVVNNLHLSVNGKNLLNNTSREFYRTDEVPFMLLAAINYEF